MSVCPSVTSMSCECFFVEFIYTTWCAGDLLRLWTKA